IGRKCAGPNDCYSASGNPVSCKEGVCQCLEGYYPNGDRSDCVLRITARKLGDQCVESIQCTKTLGDTADCINKECKCSTGSHFVEGKCHEFVEIGRKCAGPNDCYSASGNPVSCKEG
ncbi:hypothetical protein B566_EDAN019106, partial [Ephemera danica]